MPTARTDTKIVTHIRHHNDVIDFSSEVFSTSRPLTLYSSTGYKDELCLGGVWLYRATQNEQYLNDAKGFHEGDVGWALSWDDKKVACQVSPCE